MVPKLVTKNGDKIGDENGDKIDDKNEVTKLPSNLHQLQDGIVFSYIQQRVSAAAEDHIPPEDLVEGPPRYHQLLQLCPLQAAVFF